MAVEKCPAFDVACRAEIPRAWSPVTSGAISVLAGALSLAAAVTAWTALALPPFLSLGATTLLGAVVAIFGLISIIGGFSAIRKDSWRWGLAGAIASFVPFVLFGVLAILFLAGAKPAFRH